MQSNINILDFYFIITILIILIFFFLFRLFYFQINNKINFLLEDICDHFYFRIGIYNIFSDFFSHIADDIFRECEKNSLISIVVLCNFLMKFLLCFVIIYNYISNSNLIFSFFYIPLILIIIIIYLFVVITRSFCYQQSALAAEKFEFYEFIKKDENDSCYYKKVDLILFDDKFLKGNNKFQLKKDCREHYANNLDAYKALLCNLFDFPKLYFITEKVFSVYKTSALIFNILFCISLLIFFFLQIK